MQFRQYIKFVAEKDPGLAELLEIIHDRLDELEVETKELRKRIGPLDLSVPEH